MPANEKTWRDSQRMHMVFGISSLVLLLSTLWMLTADHRREWKTYQREFRRIDVLNRQWQISAEKTKQYDDEAKSLESELTAKRRTPPAADETAAAQAMAQKFAAETEGQESPPPNYAGLQEKLAALAAVSEDKAKQAAWDSLREEIEGLVRQQRVKEGAANRNLKFRRADLDVEKSALDRVLEHEPARAPQQQKAVDKVKADVDALLRTYQQVNGDRRRLDSLYSALTRAAQGAEKKLKDHNDKLASLHSALDERQLTWLEPFLQWPVLDAFNSPDRIEQIWLPDLHVNYNFKGVARFDRCTTCHQAIEKTGRGGASEPGFPLEQIVYASLATPAQPPEKLGATAADRDAQVRELYGMSLAAESVLPGQVTIGAVVPESAAIRAELRLEETPPSPPAEGEKSALAKLVEDLSQEGVSRLALPAGLLPGDVIVRINDVKLLNRDLAHTYLLDSVPWGKPLRLTIQRGQKHPFSSHPRLDLFVGDASPHPKQKFGCTACHEGQGSATAFKFASHTPSSLEQREAWMTDHGWFNNHHWIYPMLPRQFAEGMCLKCHHDVTELGKSERYPEGAAPQVTRGHELVTRFGCFGCHEVNGHAGPTKRVGPDLRLEPNFYAAALAIQADPFWRREGAALETSLAAADPAQKLELEQRRLRLEADRQLVAAVVRQPEDDRARHALLNWVVEDASLAKPADVRVAEDGGAVAAARLQPSSHRMAELLKDVETPGQLRKVGPSLRFVSQKLDRGFLYDWIREPKHFRPGTRMPQVFNLTRHLDEASLAPTARLESLEILGIAEYLLGASRPDAQPYANLAPPEGALENASAERGKQAFELRGCLACHKHADFPKATQTHGPDLTGLGSKLGGPRGEAWLYSWLREPNRYHARTKMPDLFVGPQQDAAGKVVDLAADITRYLLASRREQWQPAAAPEMGPDGNLLDEGLRSALDELTALHLNDKFSRRQTERYLRDGIPAEALGVRGDEVVLQRGAGEQDQGPFMTDQRKLLYVGRRAISKYGCYGCHDVPGYEEAKPIGTGLADWGRKEPAKLAFEQISLYLHGHGQAGQGHAGQGNAGQGHTSEGAAATEAVSPPSPTEALLEHALNEHGREGFLWQKLREPRSYDFKRTENKTYNERLRMPQFPLAQADIESVMTFVLGLVAEPPTDSFVYQPPERQRAIQAGKAVLEKYNCGGCHLLGVEKWRIEFADFLKPGKFNDYFFLKPQLPSKTLAESEKTDGRGLKHAVLEGLAAVTPTGELLTALDDDDRPQHFFDLWKPAAVGGQVWQAGSRLPLLPSQVVRREAAEGGYLARLNLPTVIALLKSQNVAIPANHQEVYGWLPPPLIGQGKKVQTEWLHGFLLDPFPIRPATVLRMPKFNLSSHEARQIVDYFAAVDEVEYPFEFNPRKDTQRLASLAEAHPARLKEALKLVTDANVCVKCHLVGDFVPQGHPTALAPNLAKVHNRLRPEYLRRWIANPKLALPYTGMPVNINYDKEMHQQLIPGSSLYQVDALVDLLLNYDTLMKQETSIRAQVKPAAPAAPAAGAAPAAKDGTTQ